MGASPLCPACMSQQAGTAGPSSPDGQVWAFLTVYVLRLGRREACLSALPAIVSCSPQQDGGVCFPQDALRKRLHNPPLPAAPADVTTLRPGLLRRRCSSPVIHTHRQTVQPNCSGGAAGRILSGLCVLIRRGGEGYHGHFQVVGPCGSRVAKERCHLLFRRSVASSSP